MIIRDTLINLLDIVRSRRVKITDGGAYKSVEKIARLLRIACAPTEDWNTYHRRRVPESCEWILHESSIQAWLKRDSDPQFIWYSVPPASGKSVLSSCLINYLQSAGYDCQFFFFKFGDQSKRPIGPMVRSLAFQTAVMIPEFQQKLLKVSENWFGLDNSGHEFVWLKLFESTLFQLRRDRPLFWVIDSLDECESPRETPKLLETLSNSQIRVKIFSTSRRTGALESFFDKKKRGKAVDIIDGESQNLNLQDIRLLVDGKVNELFGSSRTSNNGSGKISSGAQEATFSGLTLSLTKFITVTQREKSATLSTTSQGILASCMREWSRQLLKIETRTISH